METLGPPEPPGCFKFQDGTLQGWTLNQLYGWYKNPTTGDWERKKITPYCGFCLGNANNLAVAACASPLIVLDKDIELCDIFFESPDLSQPQYQGQWQKIKGFRADMHRFFSSPCFDNPPPEKKQPLLYSAQLQMVVLDTSDQQQKIFAEWDGTDYIDHRVDHNTPYSFTMNAPFLSDPSKGPYTVKKVRIRARMPGYTTSIACACKGSWLIGNVCPVV
jgi:hypothetical protein